MPVKEPAWWYGENPSAVPGLLEPVARVWAWTAARRIARTRPYRAALPVICVGNFTVGGTGKTPLSIHIAELLRARAERPAFLTRGYGGRAVGPRRVEPALDTAADVGDEPLLLARHGPVVVSRDRARGAALIAAEAGIAPPTAIVMDDGLQNPSLAKDLVIAVVDARRGLGNGRVMPAGPLRASLGLQLGLVHAVVVNRQLGAQGLEDGGPVAEELRRRFDGPVIVAGVEPDGDIAAALRGERVLALVGIANPGRFYDLLAASGASVVGRAEHADHHAFSEAEARRTLAEAERLGARIVTTEKDLARLAGARGALADLGRRATAVPIRMKLEPREAGRLGALLDAALIARRKAAGPR